MRRGCRSRVSGYRKRPALRRGDPPAAVLGRVRAGEPAMPSARPADRHRFWYVIPCESVDVGGPPSATATTSTWTLSQKGTVSAVWNAGSESRRRTWRARRDSNPRPSGPQPDALSAELRAHRWRRWRMAEREGFEPSEQVTPLGGLANRCTRPLCDLSEATAADMLPRGPGRAGVRQARRPDTLTRACSFGTVSGHT
jgi:hypothetical protein